MDKAYYMKMGFSFGKSRQPKQDRPKGGWQRDAYDLGYLLGSMEWGRCYA